MACSHGALAQQPPAPPALTVGDAVVTGFSGTVAPDPAQPRPPGKSAADQTLIDPDGSSARVIDLTRPGFVWDGRLYPAPKVFDVHAKDVGQVFGVALDDQNPPNIYLAATSAFGLNLVRRGPRDTMERRKTGGPGTGWMPGQFGLDRQGGPGSVYKVDGATGEVTLFAEIMLSGVPNPGPALGGLAYDAEHKQLFVADLYTGMIHRLAIADGSEAGAPYDHGVTGRGAAKRAPVAFSPANRPTIASPKFDATNPATWGFAAPERRVWALAVHGGRLFYSAGNGAASAGPEIWSVGIGTDGAPGSDARLEAETPAQPGPYAVPDIAFSQAGAMILAQRAPIAASYDYSAFTKPGEPGVLRYWLKAPNDPPSPGLWKPAPEEYAIGFAGQYRNTDGGVALGYGYGPDGTLAIGACEAALWTTGQNLRNDPARRAQLDPGGPLVVHGLQGNPADMVRPANEPPATSYFVDYDDKFDDPGDLGHIGGVRILAQPCAGAAAVAAAGTAGVFGAGNGTVPGGGSGGNPPGPGCVGPNCGHPPPPPPRACFASKGTFECDTATGKWVYKLTVTGPSWITAISASSQTAGVSVPGGPISLNPASIPLTGPAGTTAILDVCAFDAAAVASGKPYDCCRARIEVEIPKASCRLRQ
ncbi:MAG TPA: hypothetical protein VGG57_19385 [Stellaceae bacterium]